MLADTGLSLLTPRSKVVKQVLIDFVEKEEKRYGYRYTSTPIMARSELYGLSSHLDHYCDGMFLFPGQIAANTLALRPMTCPFQFLLYNRKQHSFRDLLVRYSETLTVCCNKATGAFWGTVCIRQFTLSDGHIICTPEATRFRIE